MFGNESFAAEIALNEKVVFYKNKSHTSVRLSANEQLFILAEILIRHLDDAYMCMANYKLYCLNVPVPPSNHFLRLIRGTQ